MGMQRRKIDRVRFELGYPARIVAIDGTWFRDCFIEDISATGAKISLQDSVEGLNLSEFFLALSKTGTAHRRCRMVWLKGDTVGATFVIAATTGEQKSKRPGRRGVIDGSRGSSPAS